MSVYVIRRTQFYTELLIGLNEQESFSNYIGILQTYALIWHQAENQHQYNAINFGIRLFVLKC
jgi:hypothetical protein